MMERAAAATGSGAGRRLLSSVPCGRRRRGHVTPVLGKARGGRADAEPAGGARPACGEGRPAPQLGDTQERPAAAPSAQTPKAGPREGGKRRAEDWRSPLSFRTSANGHPPGARRLPSASGISPDGRAFLLILAWRAEHRMGPHLSGWFSGTRDVQGHPRAHWQPRAGDAWLEGRPQSRNVTGGGLPVTVLPPSLPGPEASHRWHWRFHEVTAQHPSQAHSSFQNVRVSRVSAKREARC